MCLTLSMLAHGEHHWLNKWMTTSSHCLSDVRWFLTCLRNRGSQFLRHHLLRLPGHILHNFYLLGEEGIKTSGRGDAKRSCRRWWKGVLWYRRSQHQEWGWIFSGKREKYFKGLFKETLQNWDSRKYFKLWHSIRKYCSHINIYRIYLGLFLNSEITFCNL